MGWSWDEPLPDEPPPEDWKYRPVLESRLDALGTWGVILLLVLSLLPPVPGPF